MWYLLERSGGIGSGDGTPIPGAILAPHRSTVVPMVYPIEKARTVGDVITRFGSRYAQVMSPVGISSRLRTDLFMSAV
jgi:hypothetical protein